jgi:hypothetical protein
MKKKYFNHNFSTYFSNMIITFMSNLHDEYANISIAEEKKMDKQTRMIAPYKQSCGTSKNVYVERKRECARDQRHSWILLQLFSGSNYTIGMRTCCNWQWFLNFNFSKNFKFYVRNYVIT